MNKLRRDMEEYRAVELTEGSQMTLGEWLDRWLEEYMAPTIRDSSLSSYRRYIDCHIKPRLGYKKISRVTADDVRRLYQELQEEGRLEDHPEYGHRLSATTVRRIHSVFHQAMGAAMREGLIARNPTEGIALPKKKPPMMKILNNEQLERFMEEIKKDEVWHDFFYTELTTGLRRGELLGLQWDDLDIETGTLKIDRQIYPVKGKLIINEPKTKAAVRTIILPPPMLEVLKEYKEQIFSPWLFPSRIKPEQPIDPGYIRKRLQVILERAGCKHVRFHDLRHTFATMALEHSMDAKTLSAIIGHVSSSTTLNIYAHVTDEMRQSAAAKIDRGIAKAEVREAAGEEKPEPRSFTPYKPPRRRPGTGCVSQLNDHLWEGRYSPVWPDGKKARPKCLCQSGS